MRLFLLMLTLFVPLLTGPCGDGPWSADWYSLSYTIDQPSLPDGISFSSRASHIEIHNTSTTPLFILFRFPDIASDEQVSGIPINVPDFGPSIKVVGDQPYQWSGSDIGWSELGNPAGRTGYTIEYVDGRFFPTTYQEQNPLSPDRPANQTPPSDQPSVLTAVYGNQLISIPTITHYTLNPNYEQTVHRTIPCGSLEWLWLVPLIPWIIGLIVIGGFALFLRHIVQNGIL